MTPIEARDRVLDDHERLRGLIGDVRGRFGEPDAAYEACEILFDEMLIHMDMEDHIVGELLGELEGDSVPSLPSRRELLEEHIEQRAWIARTRAALQLPDRAHLVESIRDFLTMLEAEMALEEETLVSALDDYEP